MQFLWLKRIRASPDILPADCRDRNCHTHSGEQRFPGSPLYWVDSSIPSTFRGRSQVQKCSSPKQERCTPAARDSPVCIAWPWGCSWGGPLAWLRCPKRMPQQTRAIARNQTFICLFLFIFFLFLIFFSSLTSRIWGLSHSHFSMQTIMASHQPWVSDHSSWYKKHSTCFESFGF